MVSKVPIIVTFSHIKAEVAKFDLAVKYVKINTGLSFEQNIYNELESLMLHTKFHQNRPTGSWKQDFLSTYTIYGHGSHLDHVTSIMLINFHFPVPQSTYKVWLKMAQWFLNKSKFQFLYVNNLGPRSRNDIDIQCSLTFIY